MATRDRVFHAPGGQMVVIKDSRVYLGTKGCVSLISDREVTIPRGSYCFHYGEKRGTFFFFNRGEGACKWRTEPLTEADIDRFIFTPQGKSYLVTAKI